MTFNPMGPTGGMAGVKLTGPSKTGTAVSGLRSAVDSATSHLPLVGGIAGLTGAAFDYFGARQANKANKRMMREQMSFEDRSVKEGRAFDSAQVDKQIAAQRESAKEQMGFQERLSNTSWQRGVEDMKKAGINPILAFSQAAASTPGGASIQGASARSGVARGSRAHMSNEFAGVVSSALQVQRALLDFEMTKEMILSAKYQNVGNLIEAALDASGYGAATRTLQRLNPIGHSVASVIRSRR